MKLSYLHSDSASRHSERGDQNEGAAFPTEYQSDTQLWAEVKQSNHRAYALIYNRQARDLYRYGMSLYSEPAFIKDCIHDIFLEIWNRRQQLPEVQSIKSYLLRAVRNKVNREHRKNSFRRMVSPSDPDFGLTLSSETLMIREQSEEQDRRKLQKALTALSPRQREAIFLRFYQGLSYEEIATVMAISIKGAYKLMGRSIHFLRKRLLTLLGALLTGASW